MKIDAYFTPPEVDPGATADATVVVIDVVRATTTLIEALANGARAIYPADSTEEAVRLASSMGREDTLLCGERKGVKVEGFDLGNSPREFDAATVHDRKIVMSTTNGSRALSAAADGAKLLPCAFTNLGSVAGAISGDDRVVIVCAGREDRFSLDDALCAGHLIRRTIADSEEHELNDAARAVLALASAREPTRRFLSVTAAGAAIVEIGLGEDLDICADVDRHDIVVAMKDQAITRVGD